MNTQIIKFILGNGVAAACNFFSRFFLGFFLDYVPSIVIAYIIGMTTGYLICRTWVFESQQNSILQQIGYFTLVNIFALAQTLVISLLFANYIFMGIQDIEIRESAAHIMGIAFPIFTSYIGHKYLTFR